MTFNVKDKSLHEFFGITETHGRIDVSPYHLLQDEIIIPNKRNLQVNDTVIFELEDFTVHSRKRLISTYDYNVESYDSIGVKLKLLNFTTKLDTD